MQVYLRLCLLAFVRRLGSVLGHLVVVIPVLVHLDLLLALQIDLGQY